MQKNKFNPASIDAEVIKLDIYQTNSPVAVIDCLNLTSVKSGGHRILLVDDEDLLREVIKEIFEKAGYDVDEATNGRTALKMIREYDYDCVVSDIRMPGGDGFELVQNIFKMTGKIPKIFMITGFSEVTPAKALELGIECIFEKPFEMRKLLKAIEDVVATLTTPLTTSA